MRDFKKLGMACLVIWFGILASAKGWAQPIDLHWSDDGLRCWYRVPDVSGPSQYRVVDIAKQTVEPAFDHARVQKSIAQENAGEMCFFVNAPLFALLSVPCVTFHALPQTFDLTTK